jgi:hypothetical protein
VENKLLNKVFKGNAPTSNLQKGNTKNNTGFTTGRHLASKDI